MDDEQKDVFAGSPTGANGGAPTYTMTIHAGTPTTVTPQTMKRLGILQRQQARKMGRKNKRPKNSTDGVVVAGTKDASQSKHTGGMVALIPDDASVKNMAVTHANAEAPEEMHLTLAYLGNDVTGMPAQQQQALIDTARAYAQGTPPIRARAFAHCTFNPDGGPGDDMDSCATYLVGNEENPDGESLIGNMAEDFRSQTSQQQHMPFIPHITAGYKMEAHHLKYAGAIRFDKLRVALAGKQHDFDLTGIEHKQDDEPDQERDIQGVIQKSTQDRIDLLILTADVSDAQVKDVFADLDVELKGVLKEKPGVNNWIDRLPKALGDAWDASIVYRAAIHMHGEHGMDVGHAIASALNWAKYICDTGDVKQWPGIQNVKPPSRAEACAAIKLWQTMRAYSKAHKAGKDVAKAVGKSG